MSYWQHPPPPRPLPGSQVDVYSFAVVMWEMLTGEEPYANMHAGSVIGGIISNSLRPPVPGWCDPAWKALMQRCWAAEAADRPTFSEVVKELQAMQAEMGGGR